MKSNVKKIMEEQGMTIRALMSRIDELFPRSKTTGEKQPRTTAIATIVKARTDPGASVRDPFGIEGCTLLTLKMIARALGCRVCDLFSEDDPEQEKGKKKGA